MPTGPKHTETGTDPGRKPVGLTGGIASGKSTVMRIFQSLGAAIISGDEVAADVLVKGSDALQALADAFGSHILDSEGALDRGAMLSLLLENPENMRRQLELLAPFILPEIDRRAAGRLAEEHSRPVIVEAPLLFEYGQHQRYSPIIVVSTSRETQIARLMTRSGRNRQWATAVIDLQWPMARKEQHADYVINNDGSLASTRQQVEDIYRTLIESSR